MQIFSKSKGATLIELMVGMALGLVVLNAVIGLMVNTLYASSRNIQSSQVTQELRATMEIISRDLRRVGTNPNVLSCYGQGECNENSAEVTYLDENGVSCVLFWLDRDFDGTEFTGITATSKEWAGFRYGATAGVVEIKVAGLGTNDDCSDDTGSWVALTDEDVINVTAFNLDTSPTYSVLVSQDTSANTQGLLEVRKVNISLSGELPPGGSAKTINETIRLRNDRYIVQNIVP